MGRRRCIHVLAVVGGLALVHAFARAQVPGVYAVARTETFTNGLPVFALDGDWSRGYTPTGGDLRGWQAARAELGLDWRGWRIGALARGEAYLRLSDGAGRLAYTYQQQRDPAQPAVEDAGAEFLRWVGYGASLHSAPLRWTLGTSAWTAAARLDLMRLTRLRWAQTEGSVSLDGAGGYGFDVRYVETSSTRHAPFMRPPEPEGQGQSLSVVLQGEGPAWRARLAVEDAWSHLAWDGLNVQQARADSDTAQRTPEGYLDYAPLVQGFDVRRTVRDCIPINTVLDLAWKRPEGEWRLTASERYGLVQTWLGYASPGPLSWRLAFEPRAGATELGLAWSGLEIALGADRLDSAAHVRRARVSWRAGL